MEKDFVEIGAGADLLEVLDLIEPVLLRHAPGRLVHTRVVLGGEPGPVDGVEVGERDRIVVELVADLLAPGAVPAFDRTLCLAILGCGVGEMRAELGADRFQRVGDVGRAEIDVVRARRSVFEDRLLEPVFVIDGALAHREVAVGDIAGSGVELAEEIGLSKSSVGRNHDRPVERVAHPQIAGVLGEKRTPLRGWTADRTRREMLCAKQPVDARLLELARSHATRTLEHADDAADRSARPLALDAEDELRDVG